LAHGRQLHLVVGGLRLVSPQLRHLTIGRDEDDAPSSRAWVAGARAVGEDEYETSFHVRGVLIARSRAREKTERRLWHPEEGVKGLVAGEGVKGLVAAPLARLMLEARFTMSGPHDLFARYTFGHPERAEAELRAVLPPHVVSEVDWASLRREPGSVVDPELRETESDLLFTARLRGGRPLLLYVLLEHQSSVDRWMALRMLRYVVRQVERWRQAHSES